MPRGLINGNVTHTVLQNYDVYRQGFLSSLFVSPKIEASSIEGTRHSVFRLADTLQRHVYGYLRRVVGTLVPSKTVESFVPTKG